LKGREAQVKQPKSYNDLKTKQKYVTFYLYTEEIENKSCHGFWKVLMLRLTGGRIGAL
jgi:hypothetical protein